MDTVLSHPAPRFGAIYTKLTPSVVVPKGPNEPDIVTPMIKEGDIGVICEVLNSVESATATNQRMLKVKGLAVSRFQVTRVVCDGYKAHVDGENGEELYVVVEGKVYNDRIPGCQEIRDIADAEAKLWRSMAELEELVEGIWCGRLAEEEDGFDDECNLAVRRFAPDGGEDGEGGGRKVRGEEGADGGLYYEVANPFRAGP